MTFALAALELAAQGAETVRDLWFPESFRPVVETVVWLAAAVTGAGVIWQRFLGPFIAKPLGRVIKTEVREVMQEQFLEIRQEVDQVRLQLEKVERDLAPIDENLPLKQQVLALATTVRQTQNRHQQIVDQMIKAGFAVMAQTDDDEPLSDTELLDQLEEHARE